MKNVKAKNDYIQHLSVLRSQHFVMEDNLHEGDILVGAVEPLLDETEECPQPEVQYINTYVTDIKPIYPLNSPPQTVAGQENKGLRFDSLSELNNEPEGPPSQANEENGESE